MEFLAGFKAFLYPMYWLNPRPVPLGPSLIGGIFAFFGWFIIATIALRIVAHVLAKKDPLKADIFARLAQMMQTIGGLGLLFLFFTYEQLPVLGMRLWFLVLFVWFAVWLVRITLHVVRDYPKLRTDQVQRQKFEKYLPATGARK